MLIYTTQGWCVVALVVLAYHRCGAHARTRGLALLSLGFYALRSLPWLPLALLMIGLTHRCAHWLGSSADAQKRQRRFWEAIRFFVVVLVLTKYLPSLALGVFVRAPPGLAAPLAVLASIPLPLGLSFMVFKAIGYLADVYWKRYPPEDDIWLLAGFLTYFPAILCGPLQRANDFFRQARAIPTSDARTMQSAILLIAMGTAKKCVADWVAITLDPVFGAPGHYGTSTMLGAIYLFPLQVYLDFSGYTDLARGLSRAFAIELPPNFSAPFAARNIQDFWKRWHASLTEWLRDYVFMPLAISLKHLGDAATYFALAVNMLAMGAWHDLTPNYLAFGAIHALFICVYTARASRRGRRPATGASRVVHAVITFHAVAFAFVFFRAPNLHAAYEVLAAVCAGSGSGGPLSIRAAALAIAATALSHLGEVDAIRMPRSEVAGYALLGVLMVFVYLIGSPAAASFIYQRF